MSISSEDSSPMIGKCCDKYFMYKWMNKWVSEFVKWVSVDARIFNWWPGGWLYSHLLCANYGTILVYSATGRRKHKGSDPLNRGSARRLGQYVSQCLCGPYVKSMYMHESILYLGDTQSLSLSSSYLSLPPLSLFSLVGRPGISKVARWESW